MKKIFVFLLLFLTPVLTWSEPQIKNFFPNHSALLGQPFFWTVEIRYPVWESYELKPASCSDLKISVADRKLQEVAGEIRAVYTLAVIPKVLKTSCAPSVTVSDQKGQTTVLNGKPVVVSTISGKSLKIKMPQLPAPPVGQRRNFNALLYEALILLVALSFVLVGKRLYSNTPSQKFLRDLRKAAVEVHKNRLPIQVWRLLRSEMVWGFPAEAYTPAQLQERAVQDRRFSVIAAALRSLEAWRYSGSAGKWDKELVRKALEQSENILRAKRTFRKRGAA